MGGATMTDQLQVLIVEDEAISALALRIMLEAVGLRVCDVVDTGEAAVALAREHILPLLARTSS